MKANLTKLTLIALLSAAGTTAALAESVTIWPQQVSAATSQETAKASNAGTPANTIASAETKQIVQLKDGSAAYVFNDGRMAMETRYGHAMRMDPGTVMETADGQKILMNGDEVARLDSLLNRAYGRGS